MGKKSKAKVLTHGTHHRINKYESDEQDTAFGSGSDEDFFAASPDAPAFALRFRSSAGDPSVTFDRSPQTSWQVLTPHPHAHNARLSSPKRVLSPATAAHTTPSKRPARDSKHVSVKSRQARSPAFLSFQSDAQVELEDSTTASSASDESTSIIAPTPSAEWPALEISSFETGLDNASPSWSMTIAICNLEIIEVSELHVRYPDRRSSNTTHKVVTFPLEFGDLYKAWETKGEAGVGVCLNTLDTLLRDKQLGSKQVNVSIQLPMELNSLDDFLSLVLLREKLQAGIYSQSMDEAAGTVLGIWLELLHRITLHFETDRQERFEQLVAVEHGIFPLTPDQLAYVRDVTAFGLGQQYHDEKTKIPSGGLKRVDSAMGELHMAT